MKAEERDAMLAARGLSSASCGVCGLASPTVEFNFEAFWCPACSGPVHVVCCTAHHSLRGAP